MPFDSALHRAAILVKSLPKQQAARLVLQLDAAELQVVHNAMRNIGDQNEPDRVAALRRFYESAKRQTHTQQVSGKRKLATKNSGPFDFLIDISDSIRHQLLKVEHPKNIAIVISFLPTELASKTLNKFDPNERVAILRRLCNINKFDVSTVADLSQKLQDQMRHLLDAEKFERSGVDVASRLISAADKQTQTMLIDTLDETDSELAEIVLERVISFEELLVLSDSDIKTILKWVDTSSWAPALKTASHGLKRKILDNLNERPRDILRREIEEFQSEDPNLIDAARRNIMTTVLHLQERGAIQFPPQQTKQAA